MWFVFTEEIPNAPLGSKGITLLAFIIKAAGCNFAESRSILTVVFLTFPKLLRKLVLDSTLNYDTNVFWLLSNPSFTVILVLDGVVI
jgi:hypothetical protein